MLEVLLQEFRSWQADWDIYDKNHQVIDKPPSQIQFLAYLREKYDLNDF